MRIRAFYMDREVILDVPNNSLVFDGHAFVSPRAAEYVALKYKTSVTRPYPDEYPVMEEKLTDLKTWKNYWVCKVIRIEDESEVLNTDIICTPDGEGCVCGVTCVGTNIQNIPVYNI